MNEGLFKLLTGLLLWLVILFFGIIPLKWNKFKSSQNLLSLSNCFSGGLFLAIGLIHILPEAHGDLEGRIEDEMRKNNEEPFPLSYIICVGTFSFILFIDKILFNNADISNETNKNDVNFKKSVLHSDTEDNKNDNAEENFKERISAKYKIALNLSQAARGHHHHPFHRHHTHHIGYTPKGFNSRASIHLEDDHERGSVDAEEKRTLLRRNQTNQGFGGVQQSRDFKKTVTFLEPLQEKTAESPDKITMEGEKVENLQAIAQEIKEHHHHHDNDPEHHKHHGPNEPHHHHEEENEEEEGGHHHHHHHDFGNSNESTLKAYIILVAMGIHSIFACLAYVVTKAEAQIINMFLAMIFHKWSESLIVGISMVNAKVPTGKAFFLLFLLSIFTPLGILVGYLISDANPTVVGVCKALSAGTFIYISCAEIIVEEFSISKNKFVKFLVFLLGIGFVICMGLLE